MNNNTRLMSLVFNLEELLFTREYPSDIVLFNTFSSPQTSTPVWTPKPNMSIFLTAFQASASVPIVITLNREGNAPFMSIILTDSFATYSESFPSPIKFKLDEIISITTNLAGPVNITLLGYEF